MGKSAGKAPDPYATAQAQGQSNDQTARLNATLNRGNTITPFGDITNRNLGQEWADREVASYRQRYDAGELQNEDWSNGSSGVAGFNEELLRKGLDGSNPYRDQWQTTVSLSPEQQQLYNLDTQTSNVTGQAALDSARRLQGLLGTSLDTSGLNPMNTSIGSAGQVQQLGNEDYEQSRQRVEQAIMSRLEPQYQRDREGLEARLAAQGISVGSQAYGQAADELNRQQNDARMQAVLAGGQEQSRLFGMDTSRVQTNNAAQDQRFGQNSAQASFGNQARAQQLAELLQMRNQPINEVAALFGLGNGVTVPTASSLTPTSSQSGDLMSGVNSAYQSRSQQAAAGNQAAASAAATMAAAALMSFSDRRMKEDIEKVGKLDNGLPVYKYRYKSGGPMQIGVMAQDVEKDKPGAVGSMFGMKMVNYDEATSK